MKDRKSRREKQTQERGTRKERESEGKGRGERREGRNRGQKAQKGEKRKGFLRRGKGRKKRKVEEAGGGQGKWRGGEEEGQIFISHEHLRTTSDFWSKHTHTCSGRNPLHSLKVESQE